MKNVIIIGGGIAGLTSAHELLDNGYKVTLIERNNIVGGLARTYQDEFNKICPYEYSWRAYGKWYQNVYNIMNRIPFNETENVYDKLVILQGGIKTCNKQIPSYENKISEIPFNDILTIMPIFIKYFTSCNERNIDNFSGISLRNYILSQKLSKKTEDIMGKIVGPYLGFDYHNASLYDLIYSYEMMSNNSSSQFNFNITSLPTNHVWFEPWVKLLVSKGLVLKLNTEVIKFNIDNKMNKIVNITIYNKKYEIIKGDYYVNCTGPEVLKKILEPYKLYPNISLFYENIKHVADNGRQIQLSVYYYINKKIFLDNKNTLAYLPNTPWLLMVLPTGHIWGDDHLSKYCKSSIKEVISVGICEPYVKGIYIKKMWSECTPKEIEIEAWYQLINDKDFRENICIEDNIHINDIKIIDFKMWDSYQYKNGKIDTYEPKWANNVNTIQYRPNPKTPIINLFIGGSYSNTTTGTYSMESATESGKIVAKAVCKADNKKENIFLYNKKMSLIMTPIRFIDKLFYKNTKYALMTLLVIIIILCILFLLIKNITF